MEIKDFPAIPGYILKQTLPCGNDEFSSVMQSLFTRLVSHDPDTQRNYQKAILDAYCYGVVQGKREIREKNKERKKEKK